MPGYCKRYSVIGLLAALAGIAHANPALAANAPELEFRQVWSTTGAGEIGKKAEIVVSNDGKETYNGIETKTIDLWFSLKMTNAFGNNKQLDKVEISGEGRTIPATGAGLATKIYKFSFPYADPHAFSVVNQRNSPIKTCNDRLRNLSGTALETFRRDGGRIELERAYPFRASAFATWSTSRKKGIYDELDVHYGQYHDDIDVKVVIVCKPLGASFNQVVLPAAVMPAISAATLRIEPAQVVTVDGQLCPSQLRLYGQVQARYKFNGKAVIFGPGFLTPVTTLNFPQGGNRNIVATYPLRWDRPGGLATGPSKALKSQTINLTMNVTTPENRVVEQVKETVTVTCKAIAVVNPVAIGDLSGGAKPKPADPDQPVLAGRLPTTAPVSEPRPVRIIRTSTPGFFVTRSAGTTPVAGVDASIRLVDRKGPGGATRLFVRNAGSEAGETCRIYAASNRDGNKNWIEVGSVQMQTGRNSTVQFAGTLPSEPGLRFAVDCAGEPDNRLNDNVADLP